MELFPRIAHEAVQGGLICRPAVHTNAAESVKAPLYPNVKNVARRVEPHPNITIFLQ